MFYGCKLLTSLNLSNFNTKNVFSLQSLFKSCSNLSYIDISSFETPYLYFYNGIFDNIASYGTIIINNNVYNIKSKIPKSWKIIIKYD